MATDGMHMARQIIVEFDRSLLTRFSVAQWNSFADGLSVVGLTPTVWESGERPPVFGVSLDFSRLQRRNHRLDGVNFSLCWLADADFEGASLKGAKLGCCPRASFRNARLQDADFTLCDISDCDFTGSELSGAIFTGAVYAPGHKPVGLPPGLLAECRPDAPFPPTNPREPENPVEPSGPMVAPLRCVATIHYVPIEE
jgi:hypothetical protein